MAVTGPRVPSLGKRQPGLSAWWVWLMAFAVIAAAQFTNISLDALWHDDGHRYFLATEGRALTPIHWHQPAPLYVIRHAAYSVSMVSLGLFETRLLFCLLMAASAALLYRLYRDAFGIRPVWAVPAAILPNTLASLYIPVGLNASYAVTTMLLLHAAMVAMLQVARSPGFSPRYFGWVVLANLSLWLSIAQASLGFVLAPIALAFAFLAFGFRRAEWGLLIVPGGLMTAWSAYRFLEVGHKNLDSPLDIDVLSRTVEFLRASSLVSLDGAAAPIVAVALALIGLVAVVSWRALVFSSTAPEAGPVPSPAWRLLLFLAAWIGCSAVPFVALTPTFRPYDYAFAFNFALVLLQLFGAVALVALLLRPVTGTVRAPLTGGAGVVLAIFLLAFAVVQKNRSDADDPWRNGLEANSQVLREGLSVRDWPPDAQFIVDDFQYVPHTGNVTVNSGLVRYLLQRDDVTAVIGEAAFPANPFQRDRTWFARMMNVDPERPMFGFRRVGDRLQRVDYLLAVEQDEQPAGSPGPAPIRWGLFRMGPQDGRALEVLQGRDRNSLVRLVGDPRFDADDVLYSPDPENGRWISSEEAASLGLRAGQAPRVRFANGLELVASSLVKGEGRPSARYLLTAGPQFTPDDRLGYSSPDLAGGVKSLPIASLLAAGDQVFIEVPVRRNFRGSDPPELSLRDMSRYPHPHIPKEG